MEQSVPVTAVLSRKFYERFGEDITNELVTWFNTVDATYKADLKELIDLNFARFDAKLEQRFAQADAKLEQAQTTTLKWMFALWAPTALGVLNLLLRR